MPRKQPEPEIKPTLAITMGDPAGIGPEIVVKALNESEIYSVCRPYVVGDAGLLERTSIELGLPNPFYGSARTAVLLDQSNLPRRMKRGRATAQGGRTSVRYVEFATNLAMLGTVSGIVTGPINKKALSLAGIEEHGHTELLARFASVPRVGMLFWSPKLVVSLLTIHLPLEQAIRRINRRDMVRHLLFLESEMQRLFGEAGRIAVAALNPHAGEEGLFGETEGRELVPAIRACRNRGMKVSGPWPADSVFRRASEGEFDVVVALYHDQGLIPVKLLDPRGAVNVTLGLPFVRTSVDHGTAYDIVGKGTAEPENLVAAVRLAARLAINANRPA